MNRRNKVMSCHSGYVKAILKIKLRTIEVPIQQRGMREQQGSLRKILKSSNNKGVSHRRRLYFVNKGSVNGRNKEVIGKKSNISIIRREIRVGEMG